MNKMYISVMMIDEEVELLVHHDLEEHHKALQEHVGTEVDFRGHRMFYKEVVKSTPVAKTGSNINKTVVLEGVAGAIAELKKHRGSYISSAETEAVFKHLRKIRTEAEDN